MSFALVGGRRPRGAPVATFTARQVETNGIITPGSAPSAVYRNGALYHGWVDSSGNSGVTKYTRATDTEERTILSTSTEYNAHNNCVLDWTSDGKLVALWSKHNSGAGVQVRVASVAESVTGGFATAVALTDGGGATSYVHGLRLSQNAKFYAISRIGASNPRPMKAWSTSDFSTWSSPATWISDPTHRPYPKFLSDGVSRVDMVFTSGGLGEVSPCNIHHAYMELDGSDVETFYKTDGTLIGTSGVTPANATAVTAGGLQWSYDLAYGPDGELWMLYIRFETSSDHRIMFVKTTGGKAAWGSPVELAATGGPLYVAETYSHAGAVFDTENPTSLYICWRDGGTRHKVEKWTTANNGAAWSFNALVQSNADTTKDNFHPVSPLNHGGNLPVMFCRGTYTNWNAGYSTEQIGWVRD